MKSIKQKKERQSKGLEIKLTNEKMNTFETIEKVKNIKYFIRSVYAPMFLYNMILVLDKFSEKWTNNNFKISSFCKISP